MKGSEAKLLEYMEGAKKRFVIPVYQRNYDWKTENCKQLYDDLVKVVRGNRNSHFFGSIVSAYQPNGRYTEYLVIDGQQRLTTISLLLLAMYNLLNEGKITTETPTMAQEIFEDYLVDKHQPKETRIKLKPVKNDRSAFERLFDSDDEKDGSSNLTYNYEYFYNRILKEEITIDQLYDALFTLEIINIELTQGDNAQLIFESLNSTGLALSEGDKIRNFILMSLSPKEQEDYYDKYWNKIELCTNYQVSMFIRDFLSVKQQAIPSISKVYVTFKDYVESKEIDTEDLLKEMLAYSRWYEILIKGKTTDSKLNACIYRLNRLETTVTRPFFLEVLRLFSENKLTTDEVRDIFIVTENYLFRRSICDLPTNTLNKIFLLLHKEIIRFDGRDENYVDKFKYALLAKNERTRFPRDEEFIEAFSNKNVYSMNSKNKIYIFERIENHGTIEDKDIYRHCDDATYSIEHIMPQHLTPTWIAELGSDYEDIHEAWLHRLANLTLTGYNSKYSNNSFTEKRDMNNGFSQSGLRMNTWVAQQSKWTLDELEKRNNLLMEQALEIWMLPSSTYTPAEKQMDSYSLEDDVDLSGREIIKFVYKNIETPVNSWILMFEQILKILHEDNKAVLSVLAHTNDPDNDLNVYVSDNPASLRGSVQIDKDVFVERNTSTSTKISILKRLFKLYDTNPEELIFYLKDSNEDKTELEKGTRYELRRKYWSFALEYIHAAHEVGGSFHNVNTSKENWLSGYMGISGFTVSCVANYDMARVEIDLSKSDKAKNKSAFDYLMNFKGEIESKLGASLNWSRSEDTKGSYITYKLPDVSITNETDWTQMAKFHAEWSRKFLDVFSPYLRDWDELQKK